MKKYTLFFHIPSFRARMISLIFTAAFILSFIPLQASAITDDVNGDWGAKSVERKNTSEAELMVRVGDIDALNDANAIKNGYNPFTALNQRSHSYPWKLDSTDPQGTDRIMLGSKYTGKSLDGYSKYYLKNDVVTKTQPITFSYDATGIKLKTVLLQICIDDFQAINFKSQFSVTLNGRDAPFISELLNHIDQTGPTSYIISAEIPSGFFKEISSGKLVVMIDETTGKGDGYAVDFAKLLINYNVEAYKGIYKGIVVNETGSPMQGATVRLLGTQSTVTTDSSGKFTFEAIAGLNAIRASKQGYVENFGYSILMVKKETVNKKIQLKTGKGNPDIGFSMGNSIKYTIVLDASFTGEFTQDKKTAMLRSLEGVGINASIVSIAPASYDVVLDSRGENQGAVIKVIQIITGFDLSQCKGMVDQAPVTVCSGLDYNIALMREEQLEDAGAKVSVVPHKEGEAGKQEPAGAVVQPATVASSYDLVLENPGANKILVISKLRVITSLDLSQCKDLVDHCPATIKSGISNGDAISAEQLLEEAGATVSVVPHKE